MRTSPPQYVGDVSSQGLPGPIDFHNVTMWSFLLAGDLGQLTQFCQTFFDTPTGGRVQFKPLTPLVIMTLADLAEGRFVGNEQLGYSSERELAFAIPGTYTCRDDGGDVIKAGFASFMPYLIVDNPAALVTGREEYGFFKMFGWLGFPTVGREPAFKVDVFGCKCFAVAAKWGRKRLVSLSRQHHAETIRLSKDNRRMAATLLEAMFAGSMVGAKISAKQKTHFCDLLTGTMSQIFLKQFRDIQDGQYACYQAVTLADYNVIKLNSVSPEKNFAMDWTELASVP
jgi:hypothetical protein